MKCKHSGTVRPDSPGMVRGKKALKLKNDEDSPSKNHPEVCAIFNKDACLDVYYIAC